jgi:hypothetical protein
MPTTPAQAAPYPAPQAVPDVPADLAALATWADTRVVMRFATAAARNAAIAVPAAGMFAWIDDTDVWTYYDGAQWITWVGLDQILQMPRGQLHNDTTSRQAVATTTSAIALYPTTNFAHPGGIWGVTTRRMRVTTAGRCTGVSGGETGRVFFLLDGGAARSTQYQIQSTGAAGETGWSLDMNFTLAPGQTRSVAVSILKVANGTSTTVTLQDLTVADEGAQF